MSDIAFESLLRLGSRLLAHVHRDVHPEQLREEISVNAQHADLHLDATADALTRRGWPCRVVMLAEGLLGLTMPAVVEVDGCPGIVWQVEHGHAIVERDAGVLEKILISSLTVSLGLKAIEPTWQSSKVGLAALIWDAISQEHRALRRVAALGVAVAAASVVPPLLVALVVDAVLPHGAARALVAIGAALALLAVVTAVVDWGRGRLLVEVEAQATKRVLEEGLGRLMRAPWQRAMKLNAGVALETLQLAEEVARAAPASLLGMCKEVPTLLAAGAALTFVRPALGLSVLAGVLAAAALRLLSARAQGRLGMTVLEKTRTAENRLLEALRGAPALRGAGGDMALRDRWYVALVDERLAKVDLDLLQGTVACLAQSLQQLTEFGAKTFVAWTCLQGELSPGAFVALLGLIAACSRSAENLGTTGAQLTAIAQVLRSLDDVVDQPAPPPAPQPRTQADTREAVVIDNVWFRYEPERPWIVAGRSLRVAAGEVLMLRGGSGSGKTTLLRLIAGLVAPEAGQLKVFDLQPSSESKLVRYLPQAASLVEGSIRRNLEVLSGAPWASIREATQRTGLARWAEQLPMSLETVVAARGANLSGGERQLILLTATVASRSPLVLLDEPFANMDRELQSTLDLERLFEGRTVICVTHEPPNTMRALPIAAPTYAASRSTAQRAQTQEDSAGFG